MPPSSPQQGQGWALGRRGQTQPCGSPCAASPREGGTEGKGGAGCICKLLTARCAGRLGAVAWNGPAGVSAGFITLPVAAGQR